MQKMLNNIENAIAEKYTEVKKQGDILSGIEDVFRQVRFHDPNLALHIKKRMLELAKEKGDLP